jgi:hypothetical protein
MAWTSGSKQTFTPSPIEIYRVTVKWHGLRGFLQVQPAPAARCFNSHEQADLLRFSSIATFDRTRARQLTHPIHRYFGALCPIPRTAWNALLPCVPELA